MKWFVFQERHIQMDKEIELLRQEIAELRREVKSLESKLYTYNQNANIEMRAIKGTQSLNHRYNENR